VYVDMGGRWFDVRHVVMDRNNVLDLGSIDRIDFDRIAGQTRNVCGQADRNAEVGTAWLTGLGVADHGTI
jgi:hypothetical protein